MFIEELIIIQKVYFHLITYQFVYTDMAGQSRYRMVLTYRNGEKVAHVSCRLSKNFLNNSN